MITKITLLVLILFVSGCSKFEPIPFEPSESHIKIDETAVADDTDIPQLAKDVPILPEPAEPKQLEHYTIVVNQVPVKELLFALARDAKLNIDIHPDISGFVTINVVEQSLLQILKRISRQVDMRYEYDDENLFITTDTPFFRTYMIDYINISRNTTSSNTVLTQIASASGAVEGSTSTGGNNSTTGITSRSIHSFWETLVANVSAILGENDVSSGSGSSSVIANPESGILTVKANSREHEMVQKFIDQVMANAKRQVLVQITIVEVSLNKKYQAGIDWAFLNQAGKAGIDIVSSTLQSTSVDNAVSSFVIRAVDPKANSPNNPENINAANPSRQESLTATISLLDEFGDTKILSSPQVMVLNNQTALLKVIENIVYFEVDSTLTPATVAGGSPVTSVSTTAQTVSVGIVMTVTPQIDSDGTVTLNIRPTISRLKGTVTDPNPNATFRDERGNQIVNKVPQIAVREIESVLKMISGEIGVLGGLMQDDIKDNNAGIPGIKEVGFWGNFFKSKSAQYTKTELVIFIRPIIINSPSIDDNLKEYKKYLSKKQFRSTTKPKRQGDNTL